MTKHSNRPPSFIRRVASTWIDFVLLAGVYIVLGFISENIFDVDAYPPPRSERDFDVFWFFVCGIGMIAATYLIFSYKIIGATLGQALMNIRIRSEDGNNLTNSNIIRRVFIALFRLFLITIPGPLIALLFFAIGASLLNEALSFVLLLATLLGLFYRSFVKYKNGKNQSYSDKYSRTVCIDLSKS